MSEPPVQKENGWLGSSRIASVKSATASLKCFRLKYRLPRLSKTSAFVGSRPERLVHVGDGLFRLLRLGLDVTPLGEGQAHRLSVQFGVIRVEFLGMTEIGHRLVNRNRFR